MSGELFTQLKLSSNGKWTALKSQFSGTLTLPHSRMPMAAAMQKAASHIRSNIKLIVLPKDMVNKEKVGYDLPHVSDWTTCPN